MRRRALLAGLALAPLTAIAQPPLRAVATFTVLADMLRQGGGQEVRFTSLVGPDGDVHAYELRPADMRAVTDAALLAENGLGLEGWMQRLTGAAAFHGVTVITSTG